MGGFGSAGSFGGPASPVGGAAVGGPAMGGPIAGLGSPIEDHCEALENAPSAKVVVLQRTFVIRGAPRCRQSERRIIRICTCGSARRSGGHVPWGGARRVGGGGGRPARCAT